MSVPRSTVEQRKAMPLASGVLDYFPDALLVVAEVSRIGNEQHHPGEPLHWDKSKSTDEADALLRHLLDRGTIDSDGVRHTAKVAWRALALLQRELDAEAAAAEVSVSPAGPALLYPSFRADNHGLDGVTFEVERGPGGFYPCCGATEHTLGCPQWR